jgi:hypothetical protein
MVFSPSGRTTTIASPVGPGTIPTADVSAPGLARSGERDLREQVVADAAEKHRVGVEAAGENGDVRRLSAAARA